jgi:flagellar biogenesis protein FliO
VSGGTTLGILLRLVFSLAVVLVLMVLLARFLQQRQLGGAVPARGRAVPMRVLGRQGVGRTASVTLLDVAGTVLVLGVTEQSVQVLRELSSEELPVADEPGAPAGRPPSPGLVGLLDLLRERTLRRG